MYLGLCLIFSLVNNWTDWKAYKIHNQVVIPFFVFGLIVHFVDSGLNGVLTSLSGGCLMLCTFPFFAVRMLGAGDVKALMAMGCMAGFPMARNILLYSFLFSGLLAVFFLLRRKDGSARFRKLWEYMKFCFFTRTIHPYEQEMRVEHGIRFSFGMTFAVLWLLLMEV